MPNPALLLAVSVGRPTAIDHNGRPDKTAIWKTPVTSPVAARGVNLEGDDQADRHNHGGYDKAVYAYADEDRQWWENELDRTIDFGGFGENLTTTCVDVTNAVVGERWHVGSAVFEVSEPRVPCWKLNARMSDDRFIQRFNAAGRPGAYLRIIQEGVLQVSDPIEETHVPDHGLTVGDIARIYVDRTGAERMLEVPMLSDVWKAWATKTAGR